MNLRVAYISSRLVRIDPGGGHGPQKGPPRTSLVPLGARTPVDCTGQGLPWGHALHVLQGAAPRGERSITPQAWRVGSEELLRRALAELTWRLEDHY